MTYQTTIWLYGGTWSQHLRRHQAFILSFFMKTVLLGNLAGSYLKCCVSILFTWACHEAGGERKRPRPGAGCQLMPFLWSLGCCHRLGTLGCPGDGNRGDRGPDRSWPTLLRQLCQLTVNWTLNISDTGHAFLCCKPENISTKRVHSHLKSDWPPSNPSTLEGRLLK